MIWQKNWQVGSKRNSMLLKILTGLTFLTFGFVIYSVAILNPVGMSIKGFIGSTPFADKFIHFFMLATFALLLNGSFHHKKISFGGWQVLFGSLLVGFGITLEECSQAFIPSRNFELMDMLCNYAGIYAGSLVRISDGGFRRKCFYPVPPNPKSDPAKGG